MTSQSKTTIKTYFVTGATPTQAQFIDLIDSYQDTYTSAASYGASVVSAGVVKVITGVSGQFLQSKGSAAVPGYVTIGGASGSVTLLTTTTAANTASINLAFSGATYKKYLVDVFNLAPASDDATFRVRFQQGGSIVTSAYSSNTFLNDEGNGIISVAFNSLNCIQGMAGCDSSTPSSFSIQIYQPDVNAQISCNYVGDTINGSGAGRGYWGTGRLKLNAVTSAIDFTFDTGNIATGVFKLYGVS